MGTSLGDHLVTKEAEGKERPLGRDKFYVPGSVLRARLDTSHPLAWGMDDEIDVMFSSSPVFKFPERTRRASSASRGTTARRRYGAGGRGVRST